MALSQDNITNLKANYEKKLSKLSGAAQKAAKDSWNKIVAAAIAALTAQLASKKSLKAMDKVALAAAGGAVTKLAAKAKSFKTTVKVPTKKILSSSSGSSEATELTKTLDSVDTSNNDKESVAKNNEGRQATSVAKATQDIADLEQNIKSLERLKF